VCGERFIALCPEKYYWRIRSDELVCSYSCMRRVEQEDAEAWKKQAAEEAEKERAREAARAARLEAKILRQDARQLEKRIAYCRKKTAEIVEARNACADAKARARLSKNAVRWRRKAKDAEAKLEETRKAQERARSG
jgi:predicted  nucleic acid-binding Zn-ribbon protein